MRPGRGKEALVSEKWEDRLKEGKNEGQASYSIISMRKEVGRKKIHGGKGGVFLCKDLGTKSGA